MPSVQSLVVNYLDAARIMQLATVGAADNSPWCSTLYFAADNLHYLYWLSPPRARHSRNIAQNSKVAAAITLPQQYGQPQQGLQVEGEVRLVEATETAGLFQAYAERFTAHSQLDGILSGADGVRLYQLKPAAFVLYDERFFPRQPRQEWRLDGKPVSADEHSEQESLLIDDTMPPPPEAPSGPQVPLIIPPDHPRSLY